MPLIKYRGKEPLIDEEAWVSPLAYVIGEVEIGPHSVIWPGAILRAERSPIRVGSYSTIFDGVTMITRSEKKPLQIGNYNIIESSCLLYGSFLADYVLIQENSVVYEETSLGEGVVLLPESLVAAGMNHPARAILKGNPVSQVRQQSRNEMMKMKDRAEYYSDLFIRVRKMLPNLQPYALTSVDLFKLLLEKDPPPESTE